MRSEQRTGRPFSIPSEIQEICKLATLELPNGSVIAADAPGGIEMSWKNLEGKPLLLKIEFDKTAAIKSAEKQEIDPKTIEICVVAYLNAIRKSEVIYSANLMEIIEDSFHVDLASYKNEWLVEALATTNINLMVYAILTKAGKQIGLNPILPGTWLSKSKFKFGKEDSGFSYTVEPLTETQFEKGVPRNAHSYVEILGDLVNDPIDSISLVVYVNQDLLSRLRSAVDEKIGASIESKIELDAVSALIHKLSMDINHAEITELSQLEGSDTGRSLIRNLAKSLKLENEVLLSMLTNSEFDLLMTQIQSSLKILENDLNAVSPMIVQED